MKQSSKDLIASHHPEVAAELVEPLLRMLQLARTCCGGDVDKFLVMAVVGLRTTQHPAYCAEVAQLDAKPNTAVLPSLGVNGASIAESLGIPKETVRRKVHELIEAGWIVRRDGLLHFTVQAYRDLAPVREEMAALAARYYEVVAGLRKDA